MVPFGFHGEEGGRDTHWFLLKYHGEASAAVRRQDVGKTWGRRRTGGSGNLVGDDLHKEKEGKRCTVGGATSII